MCLCVLSRFSVAGEIAAGTTADAGLNYATVHVRHLYLEPDVEKKNRYCAILCLPTLHRDYYLGG